MSAEGRHELAPVPVEPLDDLVTTTDGGSQPDGLLGTVVAQNREAEQYAMAFLSKVVRLRGVRIDREQYLTQGLRKLALSDAQIAQALATTPVQAGVALTDLDALARRSIDFETRKSASMSFATGLPGGLTMLASVPADITQYYAHAFRVMQELAYLYGWQDLLGDLDAADDETLGGLAVFLGVMMGVGGASASLVGFAQQVTRPALQKQITKQALTKTAWYPVMKKTLAIVGVKVTKDSFAKTVTKAVPVAGGVISGGMTLVSLRSQSLRLQEHLRELPPPGADAAEYRAALVAANEAASEQAPGGVRAVVADAAAGASGIALGVEAAARDASSRTRGLAQGLLGKVRRGGGDTSSEQPDDELLPEPAPSSD